MKVVLYNRNERMKYRRKTRFNEIFICKMASEDKKMIGEQDPKRICLELLID